jgi:ParB/RepB/Spo0J family partition protein
MTSIQTSEKTINKNTRKIQEATSELLQDIGDKLKKSNDEIKEIGENPDSILDQETYTKYEAHIGKNVQLPISRIALSDNVRDKIDTNEDDFRRLSADISRNGIQQNVIVELVKTPTGGQLICVAGHRRITAAIHAGNITHVPALLKQYKNRGDRTQSALAENLLRKDLHCLDVAEGYQRMLEEGWTKDDLVDIFDRNEKTIRYYLKMAKWPKDVKDYVRSKNEQFSTRLLINRFAARRFESDNELLNSMKGISTEIAKKNLTSKKKDSSTNLKDKLERTLEQKNINPEVRIIIRNVFESMELVSYS